MSSYTLDTDQDNQVIKMTEISEDNTDGSNFIGNSQNIQRQSVFLGMFSERASIHVQIFAKNRETMIKKSTK
jgi:hypothetical protein